MKVKDRICELIETYNGIYKNVERDGIVYKEVSYRFPNGKDILCKIDDFMSEFGECEIKEMYGRNHFSLGNANYELLKPVDYIKETERFINESPIIVGDNFAIEMKAYERKVNKEYLLRADFFNDKR